MVIYRLLYYYRLPDFRAPRVQNTGTLLNDVAPRCPCFQLIPPFFFYPLFLVTRPLSCARHNDRPAFRWYKHFTRSAVYSIEERDYSHPLYPQFKPPFDVIRVNNRVLLPFLRQFSQVVNYNLARDTCPIIRYRTRRIIDENIHPKTKVYFHFRKRTFE